MMKKLGLIGAALATAAGGTLAAAPAQAQYYGDYGYQGGRGYYGDRYSGSRYAERYYGNRGYDSGYDGYYGNRGYGSRYDGYYGRGSYSNRSYYGRNSYSYGYRCRSSGTTGTVLGAIVGGLLGDAAVGRRGDGTAGAIVGAGVGALAGRAIERSNNNRC
ncbi:MAG TPA: glycine zipper domain-containing protein [Sphingomonas sp.]|nr:glycine zipper domain-containing protein [Sphingomonas sp.]